MIPKPELEACDKMFETSVYNVNCVEQELLENLQTVVDRINNGTYSVTKPEQAPCIGKIFGTKFHGNKPHGTVINGYCNNGASCWAKCFPIQLGFVEKRYNMNVNGVKTPVARLQCMFKDLVPDKNKLIMPVFGTTTDFNLIKCMLEMTYNNFNREIVFKFLDLLTDKEDTSITIWRKQVVRYLRFCASLLDPNAMYYVMKEEDGKTKFCRAELKNFALLDVPFLKSFTYSNITEAESSGVCRPGNIFIKSVPVAEIVGKSRLDSAKYESKLKNHLAFFCVSETTIAPARVVESGREPVEVQTETEETVLLATCTNTHVNKHVISQSIEGDYICTDMRINKKIKLGTMF